MLQGLRHHLFFALATLLFAVAWSWSIALLGAGAAAACLMFHGMAGLAARTPGNRIGLVGFFTFGGLALVPIFGVVLFAVSGWKATAVLAVLFFGFLISKETSYARTSRAMRGVRTTLDRHLVEWDSGAISDEQLRARVELLLEEQLPAEAYYTTAFHRQFLSEANLTAGQHHKLLLLLKQYLTKRESRSHRESELHHAVRLRLGQT